MKNLTQIVSIICVLFISGIAAANCGQCGVGGDKHDHKHAEKKNNPKTDENAAVPDQAPDFTLMDIHGKEVTLGEFADKIVVLEWTNYDCPFVKAHYAEQTQTTNKLAEKYADKDVVWLVINSTHYTTAEKTKEWANKVGLKQTVLIDADGKVGKLYKAKTSPHMFVIDKEGKVVYQGAFDNAPMGRVPEGQEQVNYVDKAISELLEGKEVQIAVTEPYGCSVKYAKE